MPLYVAAPVQRVGVGPRGTVRGQSIFRERGRARGLSAASPRLLELCRLPHHDSGRPSGVRVCPEGFSDNGQRGKTNPEGWLPQCEPDKADTQGYNARAGVDQYSIVRP
jgi:hypothetical protein